jgi:hypothetical protein
MKNESEHAFPTAPEHKIGILSKLELELNPATGVYLARFSQVSKKTVYLMCIYG